MFILDSAVFQVAMTLASIVSDKPEPERSSLEPDRRTRILDAAEQAFVQHGFHGASMQNIAAAAAMSPGNLYRYFASKEALVEGLCEREERYRKSVFSAFSTTRGVLDEIAKALRQHMINAPATKMCMMLEIWAEAGRNPAIAAIARAVDADVRESLIAIIRQAQANGEANASLDPAFGARVLSTVMGGLFKRRAHEPQFDAEAEAAMALGIFKALFAGAITPATTRHSSEAP
jgi:TetR/AcrR family transcriptional repressor of uid operon